MQTLLIRLILLASLSLFVGVGCADDTTTPASTSNNDDLRADPDIPDDPMPTNNTVPPPEPEPEPEPEPATCDGCLLDGVCRTGLTSGACGIGGEECVVCGQNEVCSEDRECLLPSDCNTMTCGSGCCDSSGLCRPGNTLSGCGRGGGFCSSCSEGSTCTDGQCQAPCGPETCAGCCDAGGACQQGSMDAACGMGGGACGDCAAASETCGNGQCIPVVTQTCAETCAGCCVGETCIATPDPTQCGASGGACLACAAGQTCSANGTCETINTANWKITVLSARINSYWDDLFSPVDGYVYAAVKLPSGTIVRAVTTTKWDTNNPVWNEVVLTNIPTAAFVNGIYFSMHNENTFTIEDICEWMFSVPPNFTPGLVEAPCSSDPGTILRWRIDPM